MRTNPHGRLARALLARRAEMVAQRPIPEISSERYRQILETAPDAMVVVDAARRILFANAQTERMFAYRRDELLGQPLELLLPERFRKSHQGQVGHYFAHPMARPMASGLELYGARSDGSEFAVEVSLSPFAGEDGVTVCAAIRDVTERKRFEAAARLNSDLRELGCAVAVACGEPVRRDRFRVVIRCGLKRAPKPDVVLS